MSLKKSFKKILMMREQEIPQSQKAGLEPGQPVYIGEKRNDPVTMEVFSYNKESCSEKKISSVGELKLPPFETDRSWVNVDGVHGVEIIEQIGKQFNIHPLTLEDISNTNQRPKVEPGDHYTYIVVDMIEFQPETNTLHIEQVSIVLGEGFVLSFLEDPGDVFESVRNRLRNPQSRLRQMGSDFLAYALVDKIVDNYFSVLEQLSERLEELEVIVLEKPTPAILQQLLSLRRETVYLRKSVWPLREVLSVMMRGEVIQIQESTVVYLRDVYDHTIQVIDTIESQRDLLGGLTDMYMSSLSFKMNEVMKVLTIISTIFIPLTFIVGVYGMNFEYMPELHQHIAYPVVMLGMLVLALGMLVYFRWKKWF